MFNVNSLKLGFNNILPIMPSVILFGLILGFTGAVGKLSFLIVASTSFIIFAGSAQFIVLILIIQEEPLMALILAGIVINLRHLLYGAVLKPYITSSWIKKLLMAYLLTDEAFLITNLTISREESKINSGEVIVEDVLIGSGFTLWSMWNISTWLGFIISSYVQEFVSFSENFIVAGTFLGYWLMNWTNSPSERHFTIFISFLAILLAFFFKSSDLIILILFLGMIIAVLQKFVSLRTKNNSSDKSQMEVLN